MIRLTLYDRSWRGLETFKRAVEALFTGIWLGLLDRGSLYAIDRRYYDRQAKYHRADYNLQGLWPWELAVLERYFANDGAVLVASVGGGREAIGLRRLGYDVDAFECHPDLVRVANELLMREGFPSLAPRDECPRLIRSYEGVIVGWGGYMLIQQRARRGAFLRALRAYVREDTPILLSFLSRTGRERYFAVVAELANVLRELRRRTQVEVGEQPRAQLRALLYGGGNRRRTRRRRIPHGALRRFAVRPGRLAVDRVLWHSLCSRAALEFEDSGGLDSAATSAPRYTTSGVLPVLPARSSIAGRTVVADGYAEVYPIEELKVLRARVTFRRADPHEPKQSGEVSGVKVRLENSALVGDLSEFLRRCQCLVEQVGRETLRVDLDGPVSFEAAMSRARSGLCYMCGAEVEGILAKLGSPLCQDCRESRSGGGSRASPDSAAQQEWRRMQLDAYLRVWQARHPNTEAQLIS